LSDDRHTTGVIHHAYTPPAGFVSPQAPVHKASTVVFPDVAALRSRDWRNKAGYTYGLHGTPTTYLLEERIAHLEGGLQCLLAPSGLAAITLVDLALLAQGDEVLVPSNAYGPGLLFAQQQLAQYGIGCKVYDPMDPASLASALTPASRLVWLEAPGSVTMEFPDLAGLVAVARAAGVTTALDNTWGAGVAFDGFALGCDIVMQALTKFPSGGGDVLMGSVTTRDEALHQRLKQALMRLGMGVAGNDAELVLRSLPSMALRYHAHDLTARALATWLQGQPAIARVLHPALPGSPGHAHWQTHCTAAAGLFSVMVDARHGRTAVDGFVDALRLFKLGYSWGGPVSLVVPYDLASMRQPAPYAGTLVRFSIGLEAEADLQADLAQALSTLNR
jgi:cysteine-S-conjugate beta-lyase